MHGTILTFTKIDNFGTRVTMAQELIGIHSTALPVVYWALRVYETKFNTDKYGNTLLFVTMYLT